MVTHSPKRSGAFTFLLCWPSCASSIDVSGNWSFLTVITAVTPTPNYLFPQSVITLVFCKLSTCSVTRSSSLPSNSSPKTLESVLKLFTLFHQQPSALELQHYARLRVHLAKKKPEEISNSLVAVPDKVSADLNVPPWA